jgi:hypothetical protein
VGPFFCVEADVASPGKMAIGKLATVLLAPHAAGGEKKRRAFIYEQGTSCI